MNTTIPHPTDTLILSQTRSDVIELARQIRLAIFDVDGVMTDGSLYFGEDGELIKRFNALDGHGLHLLMRSGIQVALITGRHSPIAARRAAELGISHYFESIRNKKEVITELADNLGIDLSQTAYMGDDIIDLTAMQSCGLSVSVPNAPSYIQQAAHWVTSKPGGSGAVRETCDMILAAQDRLGALLASNINAPAGYAQQ